MKIDAYIHPALDDISVLRSLTGIVTSVVFKSKYIQIVSIKSRSETDTVFIPRKLFSSDIFLGACFYVDGEDRHQDYYGDIIIAATISEKKPTIDLFFLYSTFHFYLLDKLTLQRVIETNHLAFANSVAEGNIEYFTIEKGVTRYIAEKLLIFSQSNLAES